MGLQTNTTYNQFMMVMELIGIITELSQVFFSDIRYPDRIGYIYWFKNIDITNNQISLNFPIKINDEIVMHPRAYGIQFEMYAGTSGFTFLQKQQDGGQPIAMFKSLDQSCDCFGDADIPNVHDRTGIDNLIANIDVSNHYNKAEIDTTVAHQTYTSSENIGITNNQISLNFPIKINDEIVMHPRA